MNKLPFKASRIASVGIELEIQLINPNTYDMSGAAQALLKKIQKSKFHSFIKPEVTQSMIELNSSVHLSVSTLLHEFLEIKNFLIKEAVDLNLLFCGGGTHPFQKWALRKIFPMKRFKNLSRIYQYLTKQATVFGQHIHIGCSSGDEAIFLTHALARYVPHLIAMSASSPYYQGIDTGYYSSRFNLFNSFPTSGVIPYLIDWQEFSDYFHNMKNLGIIETMKDFYWDIRPKPEFGTVEIRVCDTPLTVQKAVIIAAYTQSLALYLLQEKSFHPTHELYYLYNYNRFQACRYGFKGEFIDPFTHEKITIGEDILNTLKAMNEYSEQLQNDAALKTLQEQVTNNFTDAAYLRQIMKRLQSLPQTVKAACEVWTEE